MNTSPLFLNIGVLTGLIIWVSLINLCKPRVIKLNLILLGSIIFYLLFAGFQQFLIILFLTLTTFYFARSKKRPFIYLGVFLNLASILFSKWLISIDSSNNMSLKNWIPLGVSFFVFEFVHYLVEIKRGMDPETNLFRFLTFSFFFPTVVSGPIRRFPSFQENIIKLERPTWNQIETGLTYIALGFIYKFLGDYCAVIQERSYSQGDFVGIDDGKFLILSTTFRIFLDFAGYSYIAIGISRLIGINLPRNFNAPYLSTSIIDFWNRWHISLSLWVRDYLYIPLGGSRVALSRQSLNLFLSMIVIGLWHGLGIQFVVWGGLQGLALMINHTFRRFNRPQMRLEPENRAIPPKIKRVKARQLASINVKKDHILVTMISWLLTFSFVSLSWLFFFYPPLEALRIIDSVFLQGVNL